MAARRARASKAGCLFCENDCTLEAPSRSGAFLNMRMFQVNVRKSGEHDDVWTKLQPFLVNGSLTKLLKSNTGETEEY